MSNSHDATVVDSASVEATANHHPETAPHSSPAVIGASITIRGEVTAAESLVVQGIVEGTLDMREHDLVVGQSGQLVASVAAREIRVEGEVTGDLYGTEKVTVVKNGVVAGNIVSPRVTLEDGAVFKGSIDMAPAPQAELAFDEAAASTQLDTAVAATVADATQSEFEDTAGVAQHYASQAIPSPLVDESELVGNGESTAEEAKQALQAVRRQFSTTES